MDLSTTRGSSEQPSQTVQEEEAEDTTTGLTKEAKSHYKVARYEKARNRLRLLRGSFRTPLEMICAPNPSAPPTKVAMATIVLPWGRPQRTTLTSCGEVNTVRSNASRASSPET